MSNGAHSHGYRPEIGWSTLLAYERALGSFTANEPPVLSYQAFAGLSALDVSKLPSPQYLIASDGCELGFRSYDAPASTEMVFIHGSGCFGDQLHELARHVAQTGAARTHTLNMRGHGFSQGERGHAVAHPGQMVSDVAEFLAWLKRQRPESRILLAGHSAGGGVALGLSRTAADALVDGYVFLAPFLGLGSASIRPFFGGWIRVRAWTLRALTLANLLGIRRFNEATVIDFNMDACLHDLRFVKSWSFNTALAFGPGPWMADAEPISPEKPVLFLTGKRDECFVPERYPEALRVIAPHSTFSEIEGRGHWDLLVDRTALDAVATWLGQEFPNTAAAVPARGKKNNAAA